MLVVLVVATLWVVGVDLGFVVEELGVECATDAAVTGTVDAGTARESPLEPPQPAATTAVSNVSPAN